MTDNDRRDDFEFDDFFDDDQPDDFDLDGGDEPPITGGYDEDMPSMDEEPERSNRTFVILAIALILIFIIGIVAIVLIGSRPTGPNEAEQTATQVVILNSTVQAQMMETATQDVVNVQLTQTALAFTPTPTNTPLPTDTPTQTPIPPTNTPDLTATAAFLALDAISMTQTALAASPTPTETLIPTETPQPQVDLLALFATEAAQATQIGQFQQNAFATAVAIVTQSAAGGVDPALIEQIIAEQAQQLAALQAQSTSVAEAELQVDAVLATAAAIDATLSFNLALATSNAPGLEGNVQTPIAQATLVAQAVEATLTGLAPEDPILPLATATALVDQGVIATPLGVATQDALATRLAFIQSALGTNAAPTSIVVLPPTATEGLSDINAQATRIAGDFLTATALAAPQTPTVTVEIVVGATDRFIAVPTALPDTGLFDDISNGGGGIGVLAIALFGLVGVIVVARVMRSRNK